ncbi:hypothetical protein [Actinomyces wuliandei]|uniref:hypothetical protein n=1 Tax=Actinomyces wuliandei TaxID=2057743 RepID=UPI001118483B|nr:hypothetical protein [Actinomyces wuliandei]
MPAEPRDTREARDAALRDGILRDVCDAAVRGTRPGPGRRRGLAAVVAAVLLAAGGVAACSSGQDPDIPALEEAASATAGASQESTAQATSTAAPSPDQTEEEGEETAEGGEDSPAPPSPPDPGEVTAQSLSDPATSYTVVSVPDDLNQAQAEVLLAFVAYDRATWEAYRDMDGLEEVEAATTGSALESYTESYNNHAEADQHFDGAFSTTVKSVELSADYLTAVVGACEDQREISILSSSGEDQTPDGFRHTFSTDLTLTYGAEGWKVSSWSESGVNLC